MWTVCFCCVLSLQLNKSYHAAADVHQATFTKSAIVGCRHTQQKVIAIHAYFNSLSLYPSINSVNCLLVCPLHLWRLFQSSSKFMFLPQTLLWVQLQIHCWASVHTQTGSQMTACVCRRNCCRGRTSMWGRRH